jgi:hypothetical protein
MRAAAGGWTRAGAARPGLKVYVRRTTTSPSHLTARWTCQRGSYKHGAEMLAHIHAERLPEPCHTRIRPGVRIVQL